MFLFYVIMLYVIVTRLENVCLEHDGGLDQREI